MSTKHYEWQIGERLPKLGEHSLEVLREAGLSEAHIDALRARGVVRCFDGA